MAQGRDQPLVAIVGPTAAGKTALAIALAERLSGEIVGADSRQVYRYMDIGTAKPTARDRARATHHLIDIVDPDQDFSLAL
ncbi:MAG: isopentenyl transferase family protein, partial [Dehalococcoidia bacterium]|nr:isopentenyl transferase family protein [Dehalococcoidia bacterium]